MHQLKNTAPEFYAEYQALFAPFKSIATLAEITASKESTDDEGDEDAWQETLHLLAAISAERSD